MTSLTEKALVLQMTYVAAVMTTCNSPLEGTAKHRLRSDCNTENSVSPIVNEISFKLVFKVKKTKPVA